MSSATVEVSAPLNSSNSSSSDRDQRRISGARICCRPHFVLPRESLTSSSVGSEGSAMSFCLLCWVDTIILACYSKAKGFL